MDDNLIQVSARLTSHEFLMEVMFANWFATMPNAEEFSADLVDKMRTRAYIAPDAKDLTGGDDALQIVRDAADLTERFLHKVQQRAADIKAKSPQGR